MTNKRSSRQKILAAAAEIARETGAGHMSLDAIAARAGVSKGGLLYNFPTKAALMRALVETFVEDFESRLDQAAGDVNDNAELMKAYVQLSIEECGDVKHSSAGALAAIAEDPTMLQPIAACKRRLLDRLSADTQNFPMVLLIYLALEGMRSMKLFDFDILDDRERETAIAAMMKACDAPNAVS